MKRINPLLTLTAGLFIGLLCGAAITVAHSDPPKFDSEQVVAQAGETKLTRGQLAQDILAESGSKLLDAYRDRLIVAEGARRAHVSSTADELDRHIDESLKYTNDEAQKKQLEATPRWMLEEQFRTPFTLEKLLNITVSDSEAQDFYRSHPEIFIHPELIHLVSIATDSQASAESALKQLEDNVSAEDIAATFADNPDLKSFNGDIGWFDRETLASQPRVAQAIFEGNAGNPLKPGQHTDIIKDTSQNGELYRLFYVIDAHAGDNPSFEQAKDKAIYYCRSRKTALGTPNWFLDNIGDIQWKCVKDFADPQAQLVTVPLNKSDFLPKPQTQTQPAAQQSGNQ